MDVSSTVAEILRHVGGKENVVNAWHCMTRLRFELRDNDKADQQALKAVKGVIGTQFSKGQLQIIIGTDVERYYTETLQQLGLDAGKAASRFAKPAQW